MLSYLFLLELQLGMYWTRSLVGEEVKSAKGPKYRQYFFLPDSFLPWLPICLSIVAKFAANCGTKTEQKPYRTINSYKSQAKLLVPTFQQKEKKKTCI